MLQRSSGMLRCLHQLMPPDAVIDIGVGTGMGEMHQWHTWNVPFAVLVDADEQRSVWAREQVKQHANWQFKCVLVADREEERNFFLASNYAANGVLPVDELRSLWPNIQQQAQRTLTSQRLDNILSATELLTLDKTACVWCVVDCLAALPILRSAGAALERWSVLWVRVLLQDVSAKVDGESGFSAINAFLEPLGYRCVETIEGSHPAIGGALFIRDWRKQLTVDFNAVEAQIETLQAQIQQLTQNSHAQKELVYAKEERLVELKKKNTSSIKQIESLELDIKNLIEDRNKQRELVKKRDVQLQELNTQLQELGQQLKKVSDEKITQSKQIKKYKKEANELQQELQEKEYHQKLLDEEFVKAEAQIDLIKNVLLRESNLS